MSTAWLSVVTATLRKVWVRSAHDQLQPPRPGREETGRDARPAHRLDGRRGARDLAAVPRGGQTRAVLSVELALQLREAGLAWSPGQGDRFVLPGRGMDEQVFVLSDMTVQVHQLPRGKVVGFNGTTEWAMDSVRVEDALWLPREDQLRRLLLPRFVRLEPAAPGWRVVLGGPDEEHAAPDAEDAYGRAVLRSLGG